MKKIAIVLLHVLGFSVGRLVAEPPIDLDSPIHFTSEIDIHKLPVNRLAQLNPHFAGGLVFLVTYPRYEHLSKASQDALRLSLCEGRTLRQLIILGWVLRIAALKQELLEDQIKLTKREPFGANITFEESVSFYEKRRINGAEQVQRIQSTIEELLKKEPNKAPEPTPGAVTPRATEGASK
jgi:hypothetical protein